MANFKEKTTVKKGYFWDGTAEGFAALPPKVLEWCSMIKGSLVYCYESRPKMAAEVVVSPSWLFVDELYGISSKSALEVESQFDEVDEKGDPVVKNHPTPIDSGPSTPDNGPK